MYYVYEKKRVSVLIRNTSGNIVAHDVLERYVKRVNSKAPVISEAVNSRDLSSISEASEGDCYSTPERKYSRRQKTKNNRYNVNDIVQCPFNDAMYKVCIKKVVDNGVNDDIRYIVCAEGEDKCWNVGEQEINSNVL
jgi:hypothetical protein